MFVRAALLCVSALGLIQPSTAGIRYVDVHLATGSDDGSSWSNAFRTVDGVARALASAVAGDEIWVVGGTYKATASSDRFATHDLRPGVAVLAGFAGGESSASLRDPALHVTVLSGDLLGDDVAGSFVDNSLHVVRAVAVGAGTILDGFQIEGGNANVGPLSGSVGGGMYAHDSGSGLTVLRCVFRNNRASMGGAGCRMSTVANVRFHDCTFEENVSSAFGGAVENYNSTTMLSRCVFRLNTATGEGGAIYTFGSNGQLSVVNGLLLENSADNGGASSEGFDAFRPPTLFVNCTVFANHSTSNQIGGISANPTQTRVYNSIVWNNTGAGGSTAASQLGNSPVVLYSCVRGGHMGTGNISLDPRFVDPSASDFRPNFDSPCIDAGRTDYLTAAHLFDLARRWRRVDDLDVPDTGFGFAPVIDMGAYEVQAPVYVTVCPGDASEGSVCPCDNHVPLFSELGCINSTGLGGRLHSVGTARVSRDSLVLRGENMPNSAALYFQGTTKLGPVGGGSTFGDGLACAGGSVIRFGVKTNVGGASRFPESPSEGMLHLFGGVSVGGTTRIYQVWYRDAASFCTPAAFNLTNGWAVTWGM